MTTTQDARSQAATEIGLDRRRKEDQRLITGRTRWTDNITLQGMVHMAMVRSPFAHANITAINVDEAKAAPNVVAVFTGKDIAEEQGSLPNVWPLTPEQVTPTTRRWPWTGWPSQGRSSRWSWPARPPRHATPPSWSTSTTRSCPLPST